MDAALARSVSPLRVIWMDAPSARVLTVALIEVPVFGEVAADHDSGSGGAVIDPKIIAAITHEQRAAFSICIARRAPAAGIAGGGDHIRQLELHVHRDSTASRCVSVLHGIVAGFTHSNEEVGDGTRRGPDG
jgi:hypothetical protein